MNHVEWAETYQREQDYWQRYYEGVYRETVYNRVFSYLPIWPYRWRRRIARWIAERLTQ